MKEATLIDLYMELWLRMRNSEIIQYNGIPIKNMSNEYLTNIIIYLEIEEMFEL